ncbi:MAG: hypothetical protein Q8N65_00620 [bacterium]|nr:hypothetical protein [bacterium]
MTSVQKTNKKDVAISLRRRGKTYGEIIDIIKAPKSTVCSWLKNIEISPSLKEEILERSREKWRKSITAYNEVYAGIRSQKATEIREKYAQEASKEIKNLSPKDLKLIGIALYWAEGTKRNRNQLRFANSDPMAIKVIMKFFRNICKIPDEKIKAKIHTYPDMDYQKALDFWSETTNLPKTNFYPPQIQISKASKGKRARNTLPYGTLHITAGNTELASKMKGWIQGIIEKI